MPSRPSVKAPPENLEVAAVAITEADGGARAYDLVQSHHALRACEDQSLRDWKKVRAKVNISAHKKITTSKWLFSYVRLDGIEPSTPAL